MTDSAVEPNVPVEAPCRFGDGEKHEKFMDEAIAVNVACGLPPMFGLDQHVNCGKGTKEPTD